MKNKLFYQIYKLKIKSWIKYWSIKQTEFNGVLSDILEGISFYLTDSLNMKFKKFEIYGRTTQDGTPTPENPVPIKNTGDNGSVNEKISNSDGTQEQNISFPLAEGQKLMQGDYLADDGIHHVRKEVQLKGNENIDISTEYTDSYAFSLQQYKSIISQNSSTTDILCNMLKADTTNEANTIRIATTTRNIILCFEKNYVNFTQAAIKAKLAELYNNGTPLIIQFPLAQEEIENYTEEQKTAWEQIKKAKTYKNITHISSEDETPANLRIQYWKEG